MQDEKKNEADEAITIKKEKEEVKKELKIIKLEEKNLKIQKEEMNKDQVDLTDAQLADIALEQLHARAGEEELLDRWMQVTPYLSIYLYSLSKYYYILFLYLSSLRLLVMLLSCRSHKWKKI